ncbi:hypothetical protein [Spirochaeta dissipatitropha]
MLRNFQIPEKLDLSQKAGLVFAGFFLLLGWIDIAYEFAQRNVFVLDVAYPLWLIGLFFLSTVIFISSAARIVQVFSMMFTSVWLITAYGGMRSDGIWMLVFTFMLAETYGLMKKQRFLKSIAAIFLLMALLEYRSILQYGQVFRTAGAYWYVILYSIFLIVRLQFLNNKLVNDYAAKTAQIDADTVFIEVGQNTSGLVHDLKNDICRISYPRQHAQRHLRKLSESAAPEYLPALRRINEYLSEAAEGEEKLQHSLHVVRRIPSGFVRSDARWIDMDEYLRDLCTFLMFRREFRHSVQIIIQGNEDLRWYGAESDLAAICKNLIENACQANLHSTDPHIVRIALRRSKDADAWNAVEIEIRNDGEIPWIRGSCDLKDPEVFAIGKSSKSDGSGYGMVNVRRALGKTKGYGTLYSGGGCVRVVVRLPVRAEQDVSRKSGIQDGQSLHLRR